MNRRALLAGTASSLVAGSAWAQQSCFDRMDCFGGSSSGRPSLDLQLTSGALDSRITYTGGNGTYFNSAGALTAATTNVPRFDYDPVLLTPRGLLIEESRTNSIRNSTMVGAVVGTPGTLPTNWTISPSTGLSTSIVATGMANGVPFVDIRCFGTATGTAGRIPFDGYVIAATNGQTWTPSLYMALVGGSLANVTGFTFNVDAAATGPVYLRSFVGGFSPAASLARMAYSFTTVDATTAWVYPYIQFTNTAAAIDFTLRIGAPQLELGAFVTSFIPTSTVAVTRAADVATMPTGTWLNAAAGTLAANALYSTAVAGSNNGAYAELDDGTGNNRVDLQMGILPTTLGINIVAGGASQYGANFGSNQITIGVPFALAASYAAGAQKGCVMGGAVSSASGASVPTITTLRLGSIAGGAFINGYLRRVRYWPRALGNGELQADTT